MKRKSQTLGEILQAGRERKGLSLRAVEKITGISNAYVSQLESGKIQQPSPINLHKLSELYEIPYTEVLGSVGYPVPSQTEEESSTAGLGSRLGRITREEEDAVIQYLEFMRSRNKRAGRR